MLATIPHTEELKQFLPKYIANRDRGMDAGHLAEELNIALKDVISFLVEEEILVDEYIDLELFRVLIRKNPNVKSYLIRRFDISEEVLDRMLLTPDNPIVRGIWEKKQQIMLMPFINCFAWFFLATNAPVHLILEMLGIFTVILMAWSCTTERPDSSKDLILKALKEM